MADPFCAGLGIELVEASAGRATTRVTVEPRHLNFTGACHGGLTFTLADAAFGFACNSHFATAWQRRWGRLMHMVYNRTVRAGEVLES